MAEGVNTQPWIHTYVVQGADELPPGPQGNQHSAGFNNPASQSARCLIGPTGDDRDALAQPQGRGGRRREGAGYLAGLQHRREDGRVNRQGLKQFVRPGAPTDVGQQRTSRIRRFRGKPVGEAPA